jgi:hypothetical protein
MAISWARDIAFAALNSLGPQDEMGIVLWNGRRMALRTFEGRRQKGYGRKNRGMNPGDMVSFQNVMTMAHDALKKKPFQHQAHGGFQRWRPDRARQIAGRQYSQPTKSPSAP